tara:strand:- start:5315 stop:6925 length:1611 start_codon:yes stop_codon:yes gene_type:complete
MKAEKFKHIFTGLDRVHGEYRYSETKINGKRDGKMFTKHEPPTLQMYQDHLDGKMPALGIVPIRDDATATWGCIDIDEYPLDHKKILSKIRKYKLPLIMCSSKSFGAHIFLFSKNPQSAAIYQQKLKEISSYIGYAHTEVFPKQTELANEKDSGSWLNLPYHGETRYAFLDNGEGASLDEFFDLYDKYVCDDISKIAIKVEQEVIKDGPPCLQILTTQGFPEGTRNNGLLNIGVFYRKSNPDDWEDLLEAYNRNYMDPPLNATEVTTVQKQVGKKKPDGDFKYFYRCKQPPINSVCNKPLCKLRKHGVGHSTADHPTYSELSVLDSVPPIWFLNVGDRRVEFNDLGVLYVHALFRKMVGEQLKIYVPKVKADDWEEIVAMLFENIKIDEVPADVSKVGEFLDYLKEFCLSRGDSFSMDELEMQKSFTDENVKEFKKNDTVFKSLPTYFRLVDLSKWLENSKNFKVQRVWIVQRLKDIGGMNITVAVRKIQTRAWVIPAYEKSLVEIPTPANIKNNKVRKENEVLGGENIDEVDIPL